MKKFKKFGLIGFVALVLIVGVGAVTARADLTVAALSITSSGALTLAGAAGSAITVGDAAQTGTVSVGTSTGAMTLNLGTGNGAKTVAVATGTGIDTINIGTGGTAADDINVGDALADVDITGASQFVAGTGDPLTITANAASTWSTSAGALSITSADNINLTPAATFDIVVPADIGITFGTGEKIEGNNTDLTVTSGGAINLTATTDVVVPANVGVTFGTGEKIEGDSTDLTVTSGGLVNFGANGATNPVLKVDGSVASVATGVSITGAAAGSSVTLATISSGTDEKLLLNSKGRSEIRLNSRTDSTTTGDFIGVQIKPGQGATKTANGVTGVEISPRLNDGIALTTGSIIGAHIDTYLKGTTGNIGGDVRGAQIELVTDDAGARTITGDVTGLRFRSAFSAAAITGNFQAIKIEKPETQTGSQTYDAVLTLTDSIPLVWNDNPATEPADADGYIKVIVDGNVRYIQLYSTAPVD